MCECEYKKEIIRSCDESTFLVVWSLVVGLFSFVCKKMKKRAPLSFLHNCVDVGLCRRTFRERERERKRETNSISNSRIIIIIIIKEVFFVVVLVVVGIIHGTFRGGETKTKAVFGNSEEKRGTRG